MKSRELKTQKKIINGEDLNFETEKEYVYIFQELEII